MRPGPGMRPIGLRTPSRIAGSRDWILTRILWLPGLQAGVNRGGGVDTLRRFVYIHGTADEHLIGQPVSHGCIRMRNADVADLFDRLRPGTVVHVG